MNFKITKESLLQLLKAVISSKTITNYNDDWKAGRPFAFLIQELLPDYSISWGTWTAENVVENLATVIHDIDERLHLQTFVDAEDFTNGNEQCIYQYLHEIVQQFPLFTFGSGIKPKVTIGQKVIIGIFIAHIHEGQVKISVTNPDGENENYTDQPDIVDEHKNRIVRFSYYPEMEGEYKITIKYNNKEVDQSPYKVFSDHTGSDLDKVAASGPGLESQGNKVGRKTYFYIYTAALAEEEYGIEAGSGSVDCVILDPRGRRNSVRPQIRHESEDRYLVEYTPVEEGLHSVNVFFVGHQIPQSPFGVTVGPDCNAKQAYITGRGIQPIGIRVGDNVEFRIHTKDAGNGEISVGLKNPNNDIHSCQVLPEKEGLYRCFYTPDMCGKYKLDVKMNDDHIFMSPFEMLVKPYINSKIRAYGPGLTSGIEGCKSMFIVETNGETGDVGFSIRGPSEAEIICSDNGDGSATIAYTPTVAGEYAVHVLCNDDNIQRSPFMVTVTSDMKQYEPDDILEVPNKIETQIQKEESFILAFRKSIPKSCLGVECYSKDAILVPVEVNQVDEDGKRYQCTLTFQKPQDHRILISYHGVNIPQSPIEVIVRDLPKPENVKIYGPCLESSIRNQQTYFIVDCKDAGTGDIEISVLDEKGYDVICDIEDHEDGRIEVKFTPQTAGPKYKLQVYYASVQVPQSPLLIPVKTDLDLRKVVISHMRPYVYKEAFEKFVVDIRQITEYESIKVRVRITGPNKKLVGCLIKQIESGLYHCRYSPIIEGPHQIEVFCNDAPVIVSGNGNKPHTVQVVSGYDSSRVCVTGSGLLDGELEQKKTFMVDLEGAGQGGLGVTIEGPQRTEMACSDNEDGTCLVSYYPVEEGTYQIFIRFRDKDIQGSPFVVHLRNNMPGRHTAVIGMPVEIKLPNALIFTIDTSDEVDELQLSVDIIYLSTYLTKHPSLTEEPNKKYRVNYQPVKSDNLEVIIKYGEYKIKGSPFFVKVKPECELEKVKLYGEGLLPASSYLYVSENPVAFFADFTQSGSGNLTVSLKRPEHTENLMLPINDKTLKREYRYVPNVTGNYIISILSDQIHVGQSPYTVTVIENISDDLFENCEVDATSSKVQNMPDINITDVEEVVEMEANNDLSDSEASIEFRPERSKFEGTNKIETNIEEPKSVVTENHSEDYCDQLDDSKEAEETLDNNNQNSSESVLLTEMQQQQQQQQQPNMMMNGDKVKPTQVTEQIVKEPSLSSNEKLNDECKEEAALVSESKPVTCSKEPSIEDNVVDDDNDVKSKEINEQTLQTATVNENGGENLKQYIKKKDLNEIKEKVADLKEEIVEESMVEIVVEESIIDNEVKETTVEEEDGVMCNNEAVEITKKIEHMPVYNAPVLQSILEKERRGSSVDFQKEEVMNKSNGESTESIFDVVKLLQKRKSVVVGSVVENMGKDNNTSNNNSNKNETENVTESNIAVERLEEKQITENDNENKVTDSNGRMFRLKYQICQKCASDIKAVITEPNGQEIQPDIQLNETGDQVQLYFSTDSTGDFRLNLTSENDTELPKSEFHFVIGDPPYITQVVASGDGLRSAISQHWSSFSINLDNVCLNNLAIIIKGPQLCASLITSDVENGNMDVSYIAVVEGQYLIHIKYMNEDIKGSPYLMHCEKEPINYTSLVLEAVSEVPVRPSKKYKDNLSILAVSPSGEKLIWKCRLTATNFLGIVARPKEAGKYTLIPYFDQKQLIEQPYSLMVEKYNLPQPDLVDVQLEMSDRCTTKDGIYTFLVDTSQAGFGDLEVLVEGIGQAHVTSQVIEREGKCQIQIDFPCSGLYTLLVYFDGSVIQGFPIVIKCTIEDCDEEINLTSNEAEIDVADTTHLNFTTENVVTLPWSITGYGTSNNLRAKIVAPSGTVQYTDIIDQDTEHFNIQFQPTENGEHVISVKNGGMHVPGSPFKVVVGNVEQGGAHSVQVYGGGLDGGYVNEKNEFSIYTHDAGSGKLTVSMDGPSKADIEMNENNNGVYNVQYITSVRGNYMCSVKFNGEHINGSPFHLHMEEKTTSNYNDFYSPSKNITLASMPNQGLSVGRQASLILHHTDDGSNGVLQGTVVSPSGREEPVEIDLNSEDQFNIKLTPHEVGPHMIYIQMNGKSVPGSPFQIMVGEVVAGGDGLKSGRVNEPCHFWLDARYSSAGPLIVTVDGPSKVDLNCFEKGPAEYEFTYDTNIPGEYVVTIKYGANIHVRGSPFRVLIADQGHTEVMVNHNNATKHSGHQYSSNKIKCTGDGLYRAYAGRNNEFMINASKAGPGAPYVGITGPTRPCEEINVRYVGDNRFQVNYFVKEYGLHDIIVRWGDIDAPGSPFKVIAH